MTADGYFGEIPLRRYVSDLDLLKDMLLLLSYHVTDNAEHMDIQWNRAVLRVLYANGECIEWSMPVPCSGGQHTVFMKTAPMLYMIPRHPVKLIGLGVRVSSEGGFTQSTLGGEPDARDRTKGSDIVEISRRMGMDPEDMINRLSDIAWVRDMAERLRSKGPRKP